MLTIIARRLMAACLALCAASPLAAAGEVVILDYHSFLGNPKSSMDYSLEALAAQMDEIKALGYEFVRLEDAIAGRIEGKANLVLTIDDANHSVYRAFKEVFEPRSILPELFVYPAPIGKSRFFLAPERLVELAAAGCGIGAHGYYHEYMTKKAWMRDGAKVEAEARRPGPALERILGRKPLLFAYPFGVGSPAAEALLREAGYEWAFLAGDTVVGVDFSDPDLERYAVPRAIVYHWNREAIMKALAARLR
jgi:hypothetical protein